MVQFFPLYSVRKRIVDLVSFSYKSHLFTRIIIPLLFILDSERMLISWASIPLVASKAGDKYLSSLLFLPLSYGIEFNILANLSLFSKTALSTSRKSWLYLICNAYRLNPVLCLRQAWQYSFLLREAITSERFLRHFGRPQMPIRGISVLLHFALRETLTTASRRYQFSLPLLNLVEK